MADDATGTASAISTAGGSVGDSWFAQEFLWWNSDVSPEAAAFRLSAAVLLAGLVGLEREVRGKDAGLRTHMMVGLASALFTLLDFELYIWVVRTGDASLTDPMRLLQAVTAGVAFLGAGVIIQRGGDVKNLTTGGGLWMAGVIGMGCGLGAIGLAAMAAGMTLAVLVLLRALERRSER